jgi:hypothetical protein
VFGTNLVREAHRLPLPLDAEQGMSVRRISAGGLPSPSMGEGQGGGAARASPHPDLPHQGGRGIGPKASLLDADAHPTGNAFLLGAVLPEYNHANRPAFPGELDRDRPYYNLLNRGSHTLEIDRYGHSSSVTL